MRGASAARAETHQLHAAFKQIAIKCTEADCYSKSDRTLIMALIGGKIDKVDAMIKMHMVRQADKAVREELDRRRSSICDFNAGDVAVAVPNAPPPELVGARVVPDLFDE